MTTSWIEASVYVKSALSEPVADLMTQFAYQGVSIEREGIIPDIWDDTELPNAEQVTIRAYFPDDEHAETTRKQLNERLKHLQAIPPLSPVYVVINQDNWAEAWKTHYKPIRIGRRLVIRPLWEEVEAKDDDLVIALDPGMAFGTGTHATTQLCLAALEDLAQPAIRVLDLGCGSGILSIAAAKLGAQEIVALDIDSIAVQATVDNANQNKVAHKILAQAGSLETVLHSPRRFDLMAVNILARIIVEMCEHHLSDIVRPGGKAIFSGLINSQIEEVETALKNTGLRPYHRRQQGDWILIECERPIES